MPKPTIKDIAKALDINISTVSRALKDHPDISKKLKEKIKIFADQLGYTPNEYAVGLRKGKTFTIGLIIPEISMYFFPSVIKAVEEITHQKNYHLLVLHSNDSLERETQNARICSMAGVDGLMVSLTKETKNLDHFDNLKSNHIPMVFFDKVVDKENSYNVVIPGKKAAIQAVDYLFSQKIKPKKILGIFGDERLSITQNRMAGFLEGLKRLGINEKNISIYYANNPNEAEHIFKQAYLSKDKPDALLLMTDELLEGANKAINSLKIQVPHDISIIAMSDGYLPSLLSYPMPYIHTSGYEIGKKATNLLFDLIDKKELEQGTDYTETPLVV